MSRHLEQEEILRRALHAVADTIEPAADGLERIRERLSKPQPLIVAWLMAGWTSLTQPALLRMEPALAGAAGRLGSWLRLMVRFLSAAAERLGPAAERLLGAIKLLRPGSGMSRQEKLRSAIAFGAAAVIGAAGGFALSAGLPQQMISAASSFISPNQTHHTPGGGQNPGPNGSAQPFPSTSGVTPHGKRKASPSPAPSCSSKPKASASPSPSPSPTTPTPTGPTTPTPTGPTTPTPTGPTTPTPTQSAGGITSAPSTNGAADSSMVAGAASPTPTATSKATSSPARSHSPC